METVQIYFSLLANKLLYDSQDSLKIKWISGEFINLLRNNWEHCLYVNYINIAFTPFVWDRPLIERYPYVLWRWYGNADRSEINWYTQTSLSGYKQRKAALKNLQIVFQYAMCGRWFRLFFYHQKTWFLIFKIESITAYVKIEKSNSFKE